MKVFMVIMALVLSVSCNRQGTNGKESETQSDPSHYTVKNDSGDMILHIESRDKSINLNPGECAALTHNEFDHMIVKDSHLGYKWYISLDFIWYNTVCTNEKAWHHGHNICPKSNKSHYHFTYPNRDDENLFPTKQPAKNCKPLN